MRAVDIAGQRFGRLVALERRGTYWHCRCDCGNYKTIYLGNLKQGNTTSCGCYRKEACIMREAVKAAGRGHNRSLNAKFNYYKRNAKLRQVDWKLTRGDFEQILDVPCEYCGGTTNIGIDRVDSSKGYDYANVVACCTWCNQAKNDRTLDEFKQWVDKIYSHMRRERQ